MVYNPVQDRFHAAAPQSEQEPARQGDQDQEIDPPDPVPKASRDARLAPAHPRFRGGDGLSDYLRLIARVPLLTPAEELHLAGTVQEWLQHPDPPLSLRRRGTRARNRMVTANLRLVVMVCRRYRGRIGNLQLEMLDLYQAGNIGLMRAVELFDPSRGYRLSTYAFSWIHQAVQRCMTATGNGIRIPTALRNIAYRAQLLEACAEQPLSIGAIAALLGEKEQRLQTALTVVRQCSTTSLDKPSASMGEDTTLIEVIPDRRGNVPHDDYRWLHEHLDALDLRDRQVLQLRYGDDESRSCSKTARVLGVSKSCVQSVERRTLKNLRRRLGPVLDPRGG
ncbi:group2 RNA polymerase sigma factor RpoD6 [Cyanobium sp. PCC 7001]|uniref:sigma-70 family RNA polymerase sigma factor n=1 Tax=Cyanobium sp. PCC 7001 TaxID=180281 RepID=UPI0001805CF9|nr:sigma-70 family RNA polymerase sigma factor [Cyanobium sp. PCC 7001]EDY39139.1 group2 RNA polymerase sigma factor RpoD6 [Cyanobium sp. PCC 7001]